MLLRLPALCHVEGNADDRDQSSGLVIDGRIRHLHRELSAVAMGQDNLARPALTRLQMTQEIRRLLLPLGGYLQIEHVPAHRLFGRPTIQGFREAVPIDHLAGHVGRDHRLVDRIEEVGLEPQLGFAVAERVLGQDWRVVSIAVTITPPIRPDLVGMGL